MKIAESTPTHCASCFGQYPERIYVDFESAWDGPIIDDSNGMKISIDDLYICEDCLIAASNLKGLDITKNLRDENLELGVLVENLQEEVKAKDAMISDLSHTVNSMLTNPVKKKSGRPKTINPEKTKNA
jgi:hypothetical protein